MSAVKNAGRECVNKAVVETLEGRQLRSITLMSNGAGTQVVQVTAGDGNDVLNVTVRPNQTGLNDDQLVVVSGNAQHSETATFPLYGTRPGGQLYQKITDVNFDGRQGDIDAFISAPVQYKVFSSTGTAASVKRDEDGTLVLYGSGASTKGRVYTLGDEVRTELASTSGKLKVHSKKTQASFFYQDFVPVHAAVFFGGNGHDSFVMEANFRLGAYGGPGNDTIIANGKNDILHGESGADMLYGMGGNDILDGGDHADQLKGGYGNDTMAGGAGNDNLEGGAGDDGLGGGEGSDTVYGDAGKDVLFGDAGADVLYGGTDADSLYGGSGNDRLLGGYDGAMDYLNGSTGVDVFSREWYYENGKLKIRDTIADFTPSQGDRIV